MGAAALLESAHYREAASEYVALLHLSPDDPEFLEGAGRSLLGLGFPERAIPIFKRELAVAPLRKEASYWLAEALMAAGEFDQCHQLLTNVTRQNPSDGNSWFQLGILSLKNGYYPSAREAFDNALQVEKKVGVTPSLRNRIEVLRAIAMVEAGATAEAATVIPELLARPENARDLDLALINVRLLYETANYGDAFRESSRALQIAPKNAAVHFWRACLLQQSGDLANGILEAERSRDLNPLSSAPRAILVRLYRKSGMEKEAQREAAWLREHEALAGRPGS